MNSTALSRSNYDDGHFLRTKTHHFSKLSSDSHWNCRCFGPGSCSDKRVTWCRELIDEEAEQFLAHSFIDPDPQRSWLAMRMAVKLPYSAA